MKMKSANHIVLPGERIGRLTVLSCVGRCHDACGDALWRVRCDCGQTFITRRSSLRSGRTRSCGCLRAENARRLAADLNACKTVWLTGPGGYCREFASMKALAAHLGVCPATISKYVRSGKPLKNYIITTIKPQKSKQNEI